MTAPPPVPALPDAPRVTTYAAAGSAGPYNVGFAIYGDSTDYTSWIDVTLGGVEQTGTWVLDSPSGALSALARPITDARITFTNPVTGNLVITGAQRPRRLAQNAENRGVSARDFNQTYTALVAMQREAWDLRARTMLVPPGETAGLLPPAAQRANQLAGWDSLGNWIAGQPSSALVSSAMQPVVAAASTAAALALLGGAPASAVTLIGSEIDYTGLVVPPLWLPSDGTTRLRLGFPELFAVMAPTFAAVVATGSAIVTGIGSTSRWGAGWPIEGTGIAPGTTILNILDANRITMSAPATGNGTSIQLFPHGNGDGSTTYNLPNGTGRVYAGDDPAGAVFGAAKAVGTLQGAATVTLDTTQIPAHAHGTTDPLHRHQPDQGNPGATFSTFVGAGGGNAVAGGATYSQTAFTNSVGTGVTVNNAGGGLSHPNVQPTAFRRKIVYAGR